MDLEAMWEVLEKKNYPAVVVVEDLDVDVGQENKLSIGSVIYTTTKATFVMTGSKKFETNPTVHFYDGSEGTARRVIDNQKFSVLVLEGPHNCTHINFADPQDISDALILVPDSLSTGKVPIYKEIPGFIPTHSLRCSQRYSIKEEVLESRKYFLVSCFYKDLSLMTPVFSEEGDVYGFAISSCADGMEDIEMKLCFNATKAQELLRAWSGSKNWKKGLERCVEPWDAWED